MFPCRAFCIVMVPGCFHRCIFFPLNYNHILIISKHFSLALTLLLSFRLNHMSSECLQLTLMGTSKTTCLQLIFYPFLLPHLTHGLTPSCRSCRIYGITVYPVPEAETRVFVISSCLLNISFPLFLC